MRKIVIIIAFILSLPVISAEQPADVTIIPPSITVDIGDVFSFNISFNAYDNNITAWCIYQLTFYPAGKLEVLNVTVGSEWQTPYQHSGFYNNSAGTIENIQAFSPTPIPGNSTLAKIIFKAKASGTVTIDIPSFRIQNNEAQDVLYNISNSIVTINGSSGDGGGSGGGGGGGGGGTVPTPNDPPVAKIDGPYFRYINETATMNALGSTDDKGITLYTWDFGDTGSIFCNCPVVDYAYKSVGNYTIILTVRDTEGLTSTATTYALITEEPIIIPPDNNTEPINNTNNTTPQNNTNNTINNTEDNTVRNAILILAVLAVFAVIVIYSRLKKR